MLVRVVPSILATTQTQNRLTDSLSSTLLLVEQPVCVMNTHIEQCGLRPSVKACGLLRHYWNVIHYAMISYDRLRQVQEGRLDKK